MVSLWWLQLLCSWQHIYVASYISMQELCMNSVARCLNHHNYVTDRVKSHTQKDQSAPFHASWVVSEPQWTMHPCFCKCIHLLWVMVIHAQFQLDFHAVWESWDWGRETGLRLRARLRLATNSAIKFHIKVIWNKCSIGMKGSNQCKKQSLLSLFFHVPFI